MRTGIEFQALYCTASGNVVGGGGSVSLNDRKVQYLLSEESLADTRDVNLDFLPSFLWPTYGHELVLGIRADFTNAEPRSPLDVAGLFPQRVYR